MSVFVHIEVLFGGEGCVAYVALVSPDAHVVRGHVSSQVVSGGEESPTIRILTLDFFHITVHEYGQCKDRISTIRPHGSFLPPVLLYFPVSDIGINEV